jgi:hypothetical protein
MVLPARGVAGVLNAHAEVDQIAQDLHLALGLHCAAHDAERQPRLAVAGDEARDDGVHRAFAGRVAVGVVVFETEHGAAILQHESQAVGHETRSHREIVGLNEGDHHAVAIGRG